MKVIARVKPNSKINSIERTGENEYTIHIKSPPIEGRANSAAIELLSGYFKRPKSAIKILTGHKSKIKIIGISER